MATARPILKAAIATMPVASLAGIPAFVALDTLYGWTQPPPSLGNVFYLNPTAFFVRYGVYVALWNALAAFAFWGPRDESQPIAPGLSWLSGIGLIVLAFSASFAAIDWILSLEPTFWSSAFPYTQAAGWFNTGMAIVLLTVTVVGWPTAEGRDHMSDLSRIFLATIVFWTYVEFVQFLIIWEENLKTEIGWYIKRLDSVWKPAIYVAVTLGFVVPFFTLLWTPSKRNRAVVGIICVSVLLSRFADTWLLVLPQFKEPTPLLLDIAAVLALGGPMLLLFAWALRYAHRLTTTSPPIWTADHG
jgi:hypothetical protein